MSGSTWRGAHLRIAPAKPSFQARRLAELNPPVEVERKKVAARRRRIRKEMGEEVGKEAQDMRVVTPKNYGSKKVCRIVSSRQPQRLVHALHRSGLRRQHRVTVLKLAWSTRASLSD